MKLRGKKIKLCDINKTLRHFYYHAHNATFSRKAVRDGDPYLNYYSKNIKKMNDRKAVNRRMKDKLRRIRIHRYDSLVAERDSLVAERDSLVL